MRDEVVGRGRKVRDELAAARVEFARIAGDDRYTLDARRELLKGIVDGVVGRLDPAVKALDADVAVRGQEAARVRLREVTHVDDSVMAARAAVLAPVLAAAVSNPDALVRAYAERFSNPADRALLEDAAHAVSAVLNTTRGEATAAALFRDRFNNVQRSLMSSIPDDERAARDAIADADRMREYVADVSMVAAAEVAALRAEIPGADLRDRLAARDWAIPKATAAHRVDSFERETAPAA